MSIADSIPGDASTAANFDVLPLLIKFCITRIFPGTILMKEGASIHRGETKLDVVFPGRCVEVRHGPLRCCWKLGITPRWTVGLNLLEDSLLYIYSASVRSSRPVKANIEMPRE